jgi:hypothetical protein
MRLKRQVQKECPTSEGFGECSASSLTCSRMAITLASILASSSAREHIGFFVFHIGDAVIPKILGRRLEGWTCLYSRRMQLYG